MHKNLFFVLCLVLLGCGKSKDSTPPEQAKIEKEQIIGVVEKGPFIKGSKVVLIDLDDQLNPTGKTYETAITDDLGNFEFQNVTLSSNYAKLSVDGYYFDEVRGKLSTSRIVLNAFADLKDKNSTNVNLLTHLEAGRIEKLVKTAKLDFPTAKKQASKELLTAMGFRESVEVDAEVVSLAKGDAGAGVLLAVSAVLLSNPDHTDAVFTELLSNISNQLTRTGTLTDEMKEQISGYAGKVKRGRLIENMIARYKALGIDMDVTDALDSYFYDLAQEPDDDILGDDYFQNDADVAAARTITYSRIAQFIEKFYTVEALYAPYQSYADLTLDQQVFYTHQVTASNSQLNTLWNAGYYAIQMINLVIDRTEDKSFMEARRVQQEFPVLRSLLYYYMVEIWGSLPYVVKSFSGDLTPSFDALATIRDTSIAETEAALPYLTNQVGGTSFGKMKALAQAVLMRWYLQKKDYAQAQYYGEQLLHESGLQLADKDQIYQFDQNEAIAGIWTNTPNNFLFNDPVFRKIAYKGPYVSFCRLTEVVLSLAEATLYEGKNAEALNFLNQVRVRNGKATLQNASQADIAQVLIAEYKADLGAEGVYFSALKRMGKAEEVLNIEAYQKLLPIPQQEIMRNPNILQNPGY